MILANVIGDGSFGKFLKKNYFEHDVKSNYVVLAIPASAFEEVCKQHEGKNFINVCSVQHETNKICKKYGNDVLGIHPLFGHRSDPTDRRCILTNNISVRAKNFFLDCEIRFMDDETHDILMAKTHKKALEIAEKYSKYFQDLGEGGIDDFFMPASVIKLRDAIYLLDKMPPGTVDSIKSNPF